MRKLSRDTINFIKYLIYISHLDVCVFGCFVFVLFKVRRQAEELLTKVLDVNFH